MNYVISIVNPEAHELLTQICAQLELPLTLSAHGHGTAVQSMMELLGIESNEKRIVMTVADADKTERLIQAQRRYLHLGVPGHGIVKYCCSGQERQGGKSEGWLVLWNIEPGQHPANKGTWT